jgi:hypothetical protein
MWHIKKNLKKQNQKINTMLYKVMAVPTVLWGSGTWVLNQENCNCHRNGLFDIRSRLYRDWLAFAVKILD